MPGAAAGSAMSLREAATVVLLRDGANGLQTWLLRRMPRMAFAAGMSVFPGGAVDARDGLDADTTLANIDAGTRDRVLAQARISAAIAEQLGTTPEHAGRLACAAIRETFEEVGILLVRPPAVIEAEHRIAIETRRRSFADLLGERGLVLDLDAIRPWARWITPRSEPRRYDTYFFVAALPQGAAAEAVTSEASHAAWVDVAEALAEYRRGERPMLPPTVATLIEMSGFGTVEQVLVAAAVRRIVAIEPVLRRDSSGVLVAELGDGAVLPVPEGYLGAPGSTPR